MRTHTNRRSVLKALGAGGVGATTTGLLRQGQTYRIGSAVSNSGDLAVYGQRHKRGMNLALEQVNEVGIGDGGTLKVSVEDTASSPQTGVSAAQKLVNQEGVPLLIAAVSSGVTMAIARSVTIPNDVVQVSPHSTSPKITNLQDDGYVLRAAPSDAFQGAAMAQLALDQGIQRAAVIMVNNDYGRGFADVLETRFAEGGGTITNKVPYNSGKSSYRPQLNQAMQSDPEAILFVAYPESFTTMARQAFEMGIKDQVQYIGAESTLAEPIKENVPAKALNGMIGTTPSAPTRNEGWQSFVSAFREKYGQEPTVWAAYSYDATMLSALAVQKSSEFTGPALKESIYPVSRPEGKTVSTFETAKSELQAGNEIDYAGVSGSIDLNEKGDVPGTYKWWKFTNGSYQMQDFIDVKQDQGTTNGTGAETTTQGQ
ncbi:ABC transporter substrate-binding protein [Halorussus sp. MSC15.2]|uniref:ABC transporter substrate-binding protein n=1 Tax=Halorussus sp. MSC15.2 TaxID=2283638 RepID=UPI0013D89E91|nr:ABC transporter substrate-binding protein [Halorussus sp. MSC15.2]NEU58033.1 ABC transporter substrate-binding protein [Halorussus sp. MSC15.2]